MARTAPSPTRVHLPETKAGTSLYVHVPFCVVKCGYCDFNSYVERQPSVFDRFLDALEVELQAAFLPEAPVSVFVGGGTPTHLDVPRLGRLFEILGRRVDLPACPEVTMEANPESVTREKAELALAAGVRRMSMGVQSFHAHHLRFLDRAHDAARAAAAFGELRGAGCSNISIDLIFGIPGQTLAEWESDLQAALALGPDHLSCYNLTVEPGTVLHREMQRGNVTPNDEEVDRGMFLRTREVLQAAGYQAYEVSNFAGPGGPSRHNDHYWLQGDYVGVGPGACSHRGGVRGTNLKPVEAWSEAVLAGLPPTATAETLTPRQRAGEAMWLGLRRRDGVDLAALAARLGVPAGAWFAGEIARQARSGDLLVAGSTVRLSEQGLLVADRVSAAYLASA